MKAWVLHGINDFRYEDISIPEIKEYEVLLEVKAAGICGSDIARVFETGTYSFPMIPGHEFSGVVKAVGAAADEELVGSRVGVFPLIPCKECACCKDRKYEMCRNYSYLGSRTDGGFAEYVAVPAWNLIKLPDAVSFEQAAMLEPMAVAVHAMRKVQISEDETVVIYGLGTIGLLLLMFLREKGIKNILAVGNKEFQKKMATEMGLDEDNYCDGRVTDVNEWLAERTAALGADILFECVGKNETVRKAVELAAPEGKIVFVGNPYSDMTLDKNTYWKILRKQLEIKGTWNSSFTKSEEDDWNYVLKRIETGGIKPESLISHRFTMENLSEGFGIMKNKSRDYVKVIMERL